MKRSCMKFLREWLYEEDRVPLVIRGARQVGKTYIVQQLAKQEGKKLIEVNLEEDPHLADSFASNKPKIILEKLQGALETTIDPHKSLLFIDEIQAAPELFAKLRWFAEKMPELPVIAAGSLLEFSLNEYSMSIPVGRIEYMYLEPFSFEEFLHAQDRSHLYDVIKNYTWDNSIDTYTHEKLIALFKEYIVVGGMPAAVRSWVKTRSLTKVSRDHRKIMKTYSEDFGKYSKRISASLLRAVLQAVPHYLGEKFVYSKVDDEVSIPRVKQALNLLCQARVCHKVKRVDANGVPVDGKQLKLYNKIILLDTGLCSASLKLSLHDLESVDELDLVNKGGIAEQVVGQLLRTIFPCYEEPDLYYWLTHKSGSSEIDYIMQHGTKVVPIEVKAGTTGRLKSLHRFMYQKQFSMAVRINSAPPLLSEVDMKDTQGNRARYELRSMPFYLIGEMHRLLD